MTSPRSPSPQAYNQESLHSQSVLLLPGPATQTDQTMAVLRSLLPHLGLFLCLALYFSPAFSARENFTCVSLDKVSTSNNLEVSTKANVSGGNTVYTVTVHLNDSVSAVLLKAVNQRNVSVGTWGGKFENCNNASAYNLTSSKNSVFETTWQPSPSENVTEISLQVFLVINGTVTMKSEKLNQSKPSTIVTPTPPKISGTSQTTTKITPTTTAKTATKITATKITATTTAKTATEITATTTAKSLAISTLSSPLTGALHILLVFLISKLLF